MNNRELVKHILEQELSGAKELMLEEYITLSRYNTLKSAYEIALEWFENRFYHTLIHYNNNEEKAYDDFILDKLLAQYQEYVAYDYVQLASRYSDNTNELNAIKNVLNSIHNNLYHYIKV